MSLSLFIEICAVGLFGFMIFLVKEGYWSLSGKKIHVALNITDGLPTEMLRLKNSSPLIVKTRLVSCYGVPKATTLILGQVM